MLLKNTRSLWHVQNTLSWLVNWKPQSVMRSNPHNPAASLLLHPFTVYSEGCTPLHSLDKAWSSCSPDIRIRARVQGHAHSCSLLGASTDEENRPGYRHKLLHFNWDIQHMACYGGNTKKSGLSVSSSAFMNPLEQFFPDMELLNSWVNELLGCIVKAATCLLAEDNLPLLGHHWLMSIKVSEVDNRVWSSHISGSAQQMKTHWTLLNMLLKYRKSCTFSFCSG